MKLGGDICYRIEESRRQQSRLNCVRATVVPPLLSAWRRHRLAERDYCGKWKTYVKCVYVHVQDLKIFLFELKMYLDSTSAVSCLKKIYLGFQLLINLKQKKLYHPFSKTVKNFTLLFMAYNIF